MLIPLIIFAALLMNGTTSGMQFFFGKTNNQENKEQSQQQSKDFVQEREQPKNYNEFARELLKQNSLSLDQLTSNVGTICGPHESAYAIASNPTNPLVLANSVIKPDGSYIVVGQTKLKAAVFWHQFIKWNRSGSLLGFKDGSSLFADKVKIYHPDSKKICTIENIGEIHNYEWGTNLIAVNHIPEKEEVTVYTVNEKKFIENDDYQPEKKYNLKECNFWWTSFNRQGDILTTKWGDTVVLRHSIDGKEFKRCKTSGSVASLYWKDDGSVAVGNVSGEHELVFITPQGQMSTLKLPKDSYYRCGPWCGDFFALRSYEFNESEPSRVKIYDWKKRDWSAQIESKEEIFGVAINPQGTQFAVGKYKVIERYTIDGKAIAHDKVNGIAHTFDWNCNGKLLRAYIFGLRTILETLTISSQDVPITDSKK